VHETIATLGESEARDLLCESSMRTKSRTADCKLLDQFIENLKTRDATGQLNNLIDDKVLRQHYVDTFPTRSRLEPESTVRTAARATTVIGKMFTALSDKRNVNSNFVAWIARFGQIFSSLVEVSVPRSIPNLLFRHWLKLLYLFEVLLIVGATLLAQPAVAQLGWTLLGISASVNIITWWLSDFMQRKRTVFRFLILVLGTAFALLALIGALKIAWLFFGLTIDGLPPLTWIGHNLQQLSAWFESKLPKAVWGFVQRFLPLLAALLGILVLWKLGGQGTRKQSSPRIEP